MSNKEWMDNRMADAPSVEAARLGEAMLTVMIHAKTASVPPTSYDWTEAAVGVCLEKGIMPRRVTVPDCESYITVEGFWRDREVAYKFAVDAYRHIAPEFWCELTDELGQLYACSHSLPWSEVRDTIDIEEVTPDEN